MPHQAALTIAAPIVDGQVEELSKLLHELGDRPETLPFGRLPNLHFARLFVLPETPDLAGSPIRGKLLFLSDVDGSPEPYLDALLDAFEPELDEIFGHCTGYPNGDARTRGGRLSFFRHHSIASATAYVNTVGRSVRQIRQEAGLREAIEGFVDRRRQDWQGKSAVDIRSEIRAFVFEEPSLAWARMPAPRPELGWRLKEGLHAVLLPAVAILFLPLTLIGLLVWLVLVRLHERFEKPHREATQPASLETLTAIEDHVVQNPFTMAGFVKPSMFRRLNLSGVLRLVSYAVRHIYNHGRLIGIGTIHFARWVFIDGRRRMFFASNYDGSRESYMDDFIDKLGWGLNAVGGNALGYPRTRWLVLDGAKNEEAFKAFLRAHQVPTPIWYSAYPDLSTANIENNARIRAGLYGDMSPKEAEEWLGRL